MLIGTSFLGAYVLDATSAISRFSPLFWSYAGRAQGHDERISDLLRPPNRYYCWLSAGLRWNGQRRQQHRRKPTVLVLSNH